MPQESMRAVRTDWRNRLMLCCEQWRIGHFRIISGFLIAAVVHVVGGTSPGQTWDGGGADNNWTTANNWNPNVVPVNTGTANIVFAGSIRLTPSVNASQDILSLTFGNTAGAFNIGGPGTLT